MTSEVLGSTRGRRRRGILRTTMRIVRAFFRFLVAKMRDDLVVLFRNGRLFTGLLFVLIGLLSFSSDRYCDGNTSSYYACTRPATYYYYPWWATVLVIIGSFLIVLWFLRRK